MTKDQRPAPAKKPEASPQKAPASPEAEANARIAELQAKINQLKQDLRTNAGRLANRDPLTLNKLQTENEQMKVRVAALKKALYALLVDYRKPRQPDEADLNYEVLRRAAVDYFKKANIAQEIWKNIES
ncbi:MAG: hypothetical protein A2428_15735 [Bdellovibrionales bacterium RIFOXYC1_FULL_54_43]|nr:MAG: hypothetical protein A2428_15735 [Bdellovibrionales bacterium RIFOXYC1_FULL_54_43]OFZ78546.1 MAG: hypothetical protein A2603_01815 [Bdellovibrionales bacterium RIFOXYD1_FULL_55_31]